MMTSDTRNNQGLLVLFCHRLDTDRVCNVLEASSDRASAEVYSISA